VAKLALKREAASVVVHQGGCSRHDATEENTAVIGGPPSDSQHQELRQQRKS
jgi:hypothetical protein